MYVFRLGTGFRSKNFEGNITMKVETLGLLQNLQKKFGIKGTPSGSFGKIAQKLLALSFHEMGFTNIVERGVQGVDIDITSDSNEKFAIEVKTTEKSSIDISSDNLHALRDRTKDGYLPIIAVLRLLPLENWIFANIPIDKIPTGNVLIEKLRTYRLKNMENRVSPVFDSVVRKHFNEIMRRGEGYLIEKLKHIGILTKDY